MPTFQTRDNTKIYFKDWGAGRPVVLIHGWPLSSDSWDYHSMAIAEAGYRVIAYDRRGFGRSDQPFTGYNYNTLSDDLADLVGDLKLTDISIIGFSMGGGEVARYMSRHEGKHIVQTGLISSIVPLLLKTSDNPNGVDKLILDSIGENILKDRAAFYSGFFKDFYGVGVLSKPVSGEHLEWARSVAMQASLKATLDCAVAFGTTDFRHELSAFKTPTLIVHGSEDLTVPIDATGRVAQKSIKNATYKEYTGAPHGLTDTHKEDLKEDLLSFLKNVT